MTEPVVTRAHRQSVIVALGFCLPEFVDADQSDPAIWARTGEPSTMSAWFHWDDMALVLATIEHNARREAEPKWVACGERMPAVGEGVLVHLGGASMRCPPPQLCARNEYGYWNPGAWSPFQVTHWMNLPEAPK